MMPPGPSPPLPGGREEGRAAAPSRAAPLAAAAAAAATAHRACSLARSMPAARPCAGGGRGNTHSKG
eukprot:scaffold2565_cov384-Prasinococcus_capsulatus_cf.AAC.3